MNEVPETFDFMPFGEAIKDAREKNGLTREELAEQLDITPRYLQSINEENVEEFWFEEENEPPGKGLLVLIIVLSFVALVDMACTIRDWDKLPWF